MVEPVFFPVPSPLDLDRLLALTGGALAGGGAKDVAVTGLAAFDRAGPGDVALFDDVDRAERLEENRAGSLILPVALRIHAPGNAVAILVDDPAAAFARVAAALYPEAAAPRAVFGVGVAPGAVIHPDARLEPDVTVDPGAVIGPRAEIGRGAVICANAVIGADVRLGRDTAVGAGATVSNAFVGDRVSIHPGARIGHSGSVNRASVGLTVGRAIIQDRVSIGANATIDRGSDRDTVVGEGARIDNLVHIGQNVVIGRHCVIFADARIADGAWIADFKVLGGRVSL